MHVRKVEFLASAASPKKFRNPQFNWMLKMEEGGGKYKVDKYGSQNRHISLCSNSSARLKGALVGRYYERFFSLFPYLSRTNIGL